MKLKYNIYNLISRNVRTIMRVRLMLQFIRRISLITIQNVKRYTILILTKFCFAAKIPNVKIVSLYFFALFFSAILPIKGLSERHVNVREPTYILEC